MLMTTTPDKMNQTVRSSRTTRKLVSRLAQAANTILYECPSGRGATVVSIVIANTHTGRVTYRLFHLLPAETAAVSNALMYDITLQANTTAVMDFPVYMSTGDRLVAYASTASVVNTSVYGSET